MLGLGCCLNFFLKFHDCQSCAPSVKMNGQGISADREMWQGSAVRWLIEGFLGRSQSDVISIDFTEDIALRLNGDLLDGGVFDALSQKRESA